MTDYRQHLYGQCTTVQGRFADEAALRSNVANQQNDYRATICGYLPTERTAHVIDLGCGYGAFLLLLQDMGYEKCEGIDLSEEQVTTARALGVRNVRAGDVMELLAERSDVQCITMIDVIEHLNRNEAISVLSACHRALAPGGRLILRTPNVDAAFGTVLSYGDLTHELHLNKLSANVLFASLPYTNVGVLPVPPVGGNLVARTIRSIVRPFASLHRRILGIVYGMPQSYYLDTPNMIIVARK